MAELGRQSALMPAITCSSCGNQVEISLMGDHVCNPSDSSPAASTAVSVDPPPPMPNLVGGAFSSLKQNVWDKFAAPRAPPPAVDTSAANDDYNNKLDPPTPLSASTGSRTISPKTPNTRNMSNASGDDYYTPAIAGSPPSDSRRPGGYGGFGDSDSQETGSTYGTSPGKQDSNMLTRMNTIAPGPFDLNGPRSPGLPRQLTPEPIEERPSTAGSGSSMPPPPPRMPRKDGYGGFGPPPSRGGEDENRQSYGLGKRSETFPNPSRPEMPEAPMRRPSMPSSRMERLRSTSNNSQRITRKDTTRVPPPRTSLIRPPTRDGSKTPVINLEDEFGIGNPFHSPSASLSSSNSSYSQMSGSYRTHSSSNTSPARSINSKVAHQRIPSDTTNIDSLMDQLSSSMDSLKAPSIDGSGPRRPPPRHLPMGPPMMPKLPQGPAIAQPLPSPMLPPPIPTNDPAVQAPRSPGLAPGHQRTRSRANTASRGNCKACTEPITGKSVSSADGRLTGRYHKTCFVCTTCKEPFSSSTFYVLGDKPYCEHHYHKLNGSMCGYCNKGIEGQYLEDETGRKHHVGCFRCGDCGMVLRNGYFDVNGAVYCEADAVKRLMHPSANPPPPRQGSSLARNASSATSMSGRSMRRQPSSASVGLPSGPAQSLNKPFGAPSGVRLMPGQALGRGGLGIMPRMEKRMTRLGMM